MEVLPDIQRNFLPSQLHKFVHRDLATRNCMYGCQRVLVIDTYMLSIWELRIDIWKNSSIELPPPESAQRVATGFNKLGRLCGRQAPTVPLAPSK